MWNPHKFRKVHVTLVISQKDLAFSHQILAMCHQNLVFSHEHVVFSHEARTFSHQIGWFPISRWSPGPTWLAAIRLPCFRASACARRTWEALQLEMPISLMKPAWEAEARQSARKNGMKTHENWWELMKLDENWWELMMFIDVCFMISW